MRFCSRWNISYQPVSLLSGWRFHHNQWDSAVDGTFHINQWVCWVDCMRFHHNQWDSAVDGTFHSNQWVCWVDWDFITTNEILEHFIAISEIVERTEIVYRFCSRQSFSLQPMSLLSGLRFHFNQWDSPVDREFQSNRWVYWVDGDFVTINETLE